SGGIFYASAFWPVVGYQRRRELDQRWRRPATDLAEAVDDAAEQLGGTLCVIQGRVGLALVEPNAGHFAGARQHRLAKGQAGQRYRVETGERVERVALDVTARGGGLDEIVVEKGIVADQHGAGAVVLLHGVAHALENTAQGFIFLDGAAQRVVRVNAGEIQCRLVDIGAAERLDVVVDAAPR